MPFVNGRTSYCGGSLDLDLARCPEERSGPQILKRTFLLSNSCRRTLLNFEGHLRRRQPKFQKVPAWKSLCSPPCLQIPPQCKTPLATQSFKCKLPFWGYRVVLKSRKMRQAMLNARQGRAGNSRLREEKD